MELSYDQSKTLIIWGAGTKGKKNGQTPFKSNYSFRMDL